MINWSPNFKYKEVDLLALILTEKTCYDTNENNLLIENILFVFW